jgi:hypothetical protein
LPEKPIMPLSAAEVLNREFLDVRSKVLELAAAFDRLDRSAGDVAGEKRMEQLREALSAVMERSGDRAERVQMIFSRPYDKAWRETLGVPSR